MQITYADIDAPNDNRSAIAFTDFDLPLENSSAIIRNRIIIQLDEEYTTEREVWKIDDDTFKSSIGDGLNVLLGLSFVGIVQLLFWSTYAVILPWKLRNQVSPDGLVAQRLAHLGSMAEVGVRLSKPPPGSLSTVGFQFKSEAQKPQT